MAGNEGSRIIGALSMATALIIFIILMVCYVRICTRHFREMQFHRKRQARGFDEGEKEDGVELRSLEIKEEKPVMSTESPIVQAKRRNTLDLSTRNMSAMPNLSG